MFLSPGKLFWRMHNLPLDQDSNLLYLYFKPLIKTTPNCFLEDSRVFITIPLPKNPCWSPSVWRATSFKQVPNLPVVVWIKSLPQYITFIPKFALLMFSILFVMKWDVDTGGVGGFWHTCLHTSGYWVHDFKPHVTAIQDISQATFGVLWTVLAVAIGKMSFNWKKCKKKDVRILE